MVTTRNAQCRWDRARGWGELPRSRVAAMPERSRQSRDAVGNGMVKRFNGKVEIIWTRRSPMARRTPRPSGRPGKQQAAIGERVETMDPRGRQPLARSRTWRRLPTVVAPHGKGGPA